MQSTFMLLRYDLFESVQLRTPTVLKMVEAARQYRPLTVLKPYY